MALHVNNWVNLQAGLSCNALHQVLLAHLDVHATKISSNNSDMWQVSLWVIFHLHVVHVEALQWLCMNHYMGPQHKNAGAVVSNCKLHNTLRSCLILCMALQWYGWYKIGLVSDTGTVHTG